MNLLNLFFSMATAAEMATGSFFKGRFLKFRRYHNFANLFSKLSKTTLYKEIGKFQ